MLFGSVLSGQCVCIVYVRHVFSDVERHCLVGQGCIPGMGEDNQDTDVCTETVVLPVVTTNGVKSNTPIFTQKFQK